MTSYRMPGNKGIPPFRLRAQLPDPMDTGWTGSLIYGMHIRLRRQIAAAFYVQHVFMATCVLPKI